MKGTGEIMAKNLDMNWYDKPLLSVEEASVYFNIGIKRLREFLNTAYANKIIFEVSDGKMLVKKKQMLDYLDDNRYLLD